MKKKAKMILLAVIAVVAIVTGAYVLMSPAEIALTEVNPKTAELTFNAQGTVSGERVIQLYPQTSGALLEIHVAEGQRVAEGDVICTIDPESAEQRINQANSAIRSYEAQRSAWEEQTRSQNQIVQENIALQNLLIDQAQHDLDQAKKDLERAQFLYEDGSLALADVEQAQSAVMQYELALESRQQERSVISLNTGGTSMRAHYDALIEMERANIVLLEKELHSTVVTAVADGVVTSLPAQNLNYVSPGVSVAELTVTGDLRVEAYVATADIDSVKPGDEVRLTLKRRDGDVKFTGRVSHIHETAELTISALGLEERRVKVEITPDLSSLNGAGFGVGYDVDAQFLLYSEDAQLTVPKTALFEDGGRDMVWIAEGGKLRSVAVETGMELRTEVVIVSGLVPGSIVVTDANDSAVKNGLRVSVGHERRER